MRRPRAALAAAAVSAALVAAGCGGAGEGAAAAGESAPAAAGSPAAGSPAAGNATAVRDVVLITIDTLRADVLGFAGHDAVATPVMDRLAAAGRVFPRAYAHNVVTLPSHANILTGRYPFDHGIRDNTGFVLGEDVPTLATELRQAGWRTGAFVAAYPLDARYGLDRGFDRYDDDYPQRGDPTRLVMPERPGDEVVSRALDWWRAQEGERRFLWLHLYDPHAPYAPAAPFAGRHPGEPYLDEVEATDAYLAPLLEPLLDDPARAGDTLLVFTSDHGEALGEHGELTHGLFCYEATIHIPLVLWGAGVEPGRDERVAGHVDLMPTVLAAVGRPVPSGLPGRPLLAAEDEPWPAERALYFEAMSTYLNRGWAPLRGVLRARHKYVDLPLPELYDVVADRAEANNLVREERRLYHGLRDALPEASAALPEAGAVSPEEAAQLRALGYLAGGGGGGERDFGPEDDPKNLVELDRGIQALTDAYRRGELARAEAIGRELLAARPSMPLVVDQLSLVLRQQEKLGEAVAVLEAAFDRGLEDRTLLRTYGLTLAETGRAGDAVEVLEPIAGDDAEMLTALGIAYSDAGRQDDAMEALRRALEADPEWPQAHETLGVVLLRRGETAAARGALEQALELNPRSAIAWNTLGVARYQGGDPPAALEAWRRALELDGRQWDALFNLGLTAASLGRAEEARRALERYVREAPRPRYEADVARARQVLAELPG